MNQQSYFSGYTQSKLKFEKTHALQNSFQHYLQQPLHGSKLNTHQQMTRKKKSVVHIHTMKYYSAIKKE